MDTTSNRLKQVMEELDINQSELVRRTGINKGALSSYISGRYIPKQRAIYALASALDVSEPWLMGYDVPKNRVEDSNSSLSPNEKKTLGYISCFGRQRPTHSGYSHANGIRKS